MEYDLVKTKKDPWEIKLPKGIEKYVHGILPHLIVYDRFKKRAFCLSCGEYFSYTTKIHADETVKCPLCKHKGRTVPHTRRHDSTYESFATARAEKGKIYFTIMTAAYYFEGKKDFEQLKDKRGRIYIDEVGVIGREEQKCFINYCDGFCATKKPHAVRGEVWLYIHRSFPAAVKQSCLRYADVSPRTGRCGDINAMIKRLALNAKYPQLEYLKKAGLGEIENAMVYGQRTYLKPNWKRKDLPGVLGLSSQDLDKLRQWDMWDIDNIAAYKEMKKRRQKLRKQDMKIFFSFFSNIGPFSAPAKFTYDKSFYGLDPVKTAAYLEKVFQENMPDCHQGAYGYSRSRILYEYKDYLNQAEKLGYPKSEYYLYPPDFIAAHDRVSEEYREKQDQKKQREKQKQQERYEEKYLPKLKALAWSNGTYLIRPLENYMDFSAEGKNNVNCVAGYYDRVTKGQTAVFVIRCIDAPDTSLVTVELKNGKMLQCRARGNREPAEDILRFAGEWLEKIVRKGKKGETASAA